MGYALSDGRQVTLRNYTEIYKQYSEDILDEVRLAVLDSTNISEYVRDCRSDSYKLGQIRKCIRGGVPSEYINMNFSGKVLFNIRSGLSAGCDMMPLLEYADGSLKAETLEMISDFLLLGVDITKVDFRRIPKDLAIEFLRGLHSGYPMWLLLDDSVKLSRQLVQVLKRAMFMNLDIHPFLDNGYDVKTITMILSYSSKVDIGAFMTMVNSKFSVGHIQAILDWASKGVDIKRLCLRDAYGDPMYNRYQIAVLGEALQKGIEDDSIWNPNLSDMEMQQKINRKIFK